MTYIVIIVLVILIALLYFLTGKKKKNLRFGNAVTLDKKFVQDKWLEIEQTFMIGGPSNFKASLMEADKLVDYVLKGKGVKGENMGERLKNARGKFTSYDDYNNLWFAHKVRNNIAHEASHELYSAEAKRAFDYFKKAMKELGVL